MIGVGVSFVLMWFARTFAGGPPATMTKEYQEQTNEYLKVRLPPSLYSFSANSPSKRTRREYDGAARDIMALWKWDSRG